MNKFAVALIALLVGMSIMKGQYIGAISAIFFTLVFIYTPEKSAKK